MMPFGKWLRKRKKQEPVSGRMSDEESRALLSKKTQQDPQDRELTPEELDDLWTADPRTGITDAQRAAASVNNPISDVNPNELEALWKSTPTSKRRD